VECTLPESLGVKNPSDGELAAENPGRFARYSRIKGEATRITLQHRWPRNKVNDVDWQQKLRFVSRTPRWVIADNFVSVSGVTVSNATPHNMEGARVASTLSAKIDFVVSELGLAKLSGTDLPALLPEQV